MSAIYLNCEVGDTLKCSDKDQSIHCAGMTLLLQEFSVLRFGEKILTGRTRPKQESDCRRREK
jgi:hypothetical protein